MVEMNATVIAEIVRQVHAEDYEGRCTRFHAKLRAVEKISGMSASDFRAEYAAVLMLIGPLISELNARQIAKMLTRALALTVVTEAKNRSLDAKDQTIAANEMAIAANERTIAAQSRTIFTLADELGIALPKTARFERGPVH